MIFVIMTVFPAPILYGMVIDSSCLLWAPGTQRDKKGSCQLYSRNSFRLRFHGLSIGKSINLIYKESSKAKYESIKKKHSLRHIWGGHSWL